MRVPDTRNSEDPIPILQLQGTNLEGLILKSNVDRTIGDDKIVSAMHLDRLESGLRFARSRLCPVPGHFHRARDDDVARLNFKPTARRRNERQIGLLQLQFPLVRVAAPPTQLAVKLHADTIQIGANDLQPGTVDGDFRPQIAQVLAAHAEIFAIQGEIPETTALSELDVPLQRKDSGARAGQTLDLMRVTNLEILRRDLQVSLRAIDATVNLDLTTQESSIQRANFQRVRGNGSVEIEAPQRL